MNFPLLKNKKKPMGGIQSDEILGGPAAHAMSLVDHLIELRKRLIVGFIAFGVACLCVYPFSQEIFAFLVRPLTHLLGAGRPMIYTGLAEAFVTYLKVTLFGGLIVSSPVILGQIWLFIAPALYTKERQNFILFLIATPILFLLGAVLAYGVVCPMAWKFFLSFEGIHSQSGVRVHLEARMSEYLSLMMKLILAFGLSFQLPVVLLLLARVGVLTPSVLKARRKYAFLGIVIGSAIVTPPDFLSPLGLIVPLYSLYELSIFLMRLSDKKIKGNAGLPEIFQK